MAPSHLHGLNLVYPETQPSSYSLSDADLLAIPNYPPELSAQLDLWTNLAFQSDESAAPLSSSRGGLSKDSPASTEEDEEDEQREGPARAEGHENVVTGTIVEQQQPPHPQPPQIPSASQFDLMAFLASMGMPPHVQAPNLPAPPAGINAPSLASILSLYSNQSQSSTPSAASPAAPTSTSDASASSGPRAKRARSRKASVAGDAAPVVDVSIDSLEDFEPAEGALTTPLNPTEDKRRRNTAASARFRAKKKEREAALEKRSKDLEGRVADLERECEALRRENGWLKGLVVGVTGAGAGAGALPQSAATVGQKRSRDD